MVARKTERRLPFDFAPEDIGQAVVSNDSRFFLVGFNQNPATQSRLQRFAVFVTDDALAGQVDHFDWTLVNGSANDALSTDVGYHEYTPMEIGSLSVQATPIDGGGANLGTVTLDLSVVALNPELEALREQTTDAGPLAGQPEAAREIVNDIRAYIDDLAPRDADANGSLNRMVFAIAYAEAIRTSGMQRARVVEEIADALSGDDSAALLNRAPEGIGACRIRPHVLAMFLSAEASSDPLVAKVSLPKDPDKRVEVENNLLTALEALSEEQRIDLFNVLRFPKLNVRMAIQLVDALKNDFYSGDALVDVMTDKDKATNLIQQFSTGPLAAP